MFRIIVLSLLFLLNCVEDIYVLKEPINGDTPGAVAFGLFIFKSDDEISAKSISIDNYQHYKTTFSGVTESGISNFIFKYGDSDEIRKVNGKKLISAKNTLLEKNGNLVFYVLTDLDSDTEYFLRAVEYSYTNIVFNANGSSSSKTYYFSLPIDPDQSRAVLSFRLIPGKVEYKGIFGVKEEIGEKGKSFLATGRSKKGVLINGEEILAKSEDKKLQERFFGKNKMTRAGGEDHFYELFYENHISGYWRSPSRRLQINDK